MTDLIYDIGMNAGEDSRFYLLKGFRVVAVEADPQLCGVAEHALRDFVATGQLTIVNRAIAEQAGPTMFYRSAVQGWGTIDSHWNEDNGARGISSEPIQVEAISLAQLVDQYGHPYYMKLDIEGMDRKAVRSLASTTIRPDYLSMETSFSRIPTFAAFRTDLESLAGLGYDRFRIVDQQAVPRQVPPRPSRAGNYVPYDFHNGESGLFAEEAPGEWMTMEQALASFRRLMRAKWLQLLLYPRLRLYLRYCAIIHRLTGKCPNLGWYDIHARHSAVG